MKKWGIRTVYFYEADESNYLHPSSTLTSSTVCASSASLSYPCDSILIKLCICCLKCKNRWEMILMISGMKGKNENKRVKIIMSGMGYKIKKVYKKIRKKMDKKNPQKN